MKLSKFIFVGALAALSALGLGLAAKSAHVAKEAAAEQVARGKYLVTFGGCTDCHTPVKMGPQGPEPDLTRFLSGHPADANFPPPPKLGEGPWFAVTGGFTAWAGPWGISYAANLTPDINTGLGIWTEDTFLKAMRTGKHHGVARDILPPMPWQNVSVLNDADIKAVFAYLRTIPAVKNQVPEPVGPAGPTSFE